MFKLIIALSALCAVASAGYLGGYGLGGYGLSGHGLGYGGYSGYSGYSGIVAPAYHAPTVVAAAPIVKTYSAPIIAAPLATSYANTYKVATKAIPIVHAAPAVYAAPAYHGSLGYGLNYGYGHGLLHK
ncbi:PREDICTED: cuticle protein 65-like [Rhagoletis zephyria]|uniref:cuticle protein 65-like n=1 Tax=Rhagoletis zephyria TaxID=28612 RepID=UPI0008117086|nr:PREDICTED: cuticle protein 65-like [Rhagoletis zephyria]XP_036337383.1 cuticle protein 65-like [Rhagoletis pomonella]